MGLFGKKKDIGSLGEVPVPPDMPQSMNATQPFPQASVQEQQGPSAGQPNYYNQEPAIGPADQIPPQDMSQPMPDTAPQGMQQEPHTPPEQTSPDQNIPQAQFPEPFPTQDNTKERIEEIAEAIIDEKWNELIRDINKVIEWKERTDGEIKRIVQEIINLKERFESLHKGILGKITEYDQNLSNVGSEIKAMQMAFQKILPTFTENVNKLDRIVRSAGSRE